MLHLVDVLIRDLLLAQVPGLTLEDQVRFQPPDATMRTDVANLNRMALGMYLVDIRENRRLRSNERTRSFEHGTVYMEQMPERIDCHYLLTAWSPAQLAPGVDPTLDEHALLYEALGALLRYAPLVPSAIYPPASVKLAAWPVRFRSDDIPLAVVPTEGFLKLSEFWNSMGPGMPWKPVVYFTTTIPVTLLRENAGPMVTTRITEYRQSDHPEAAEVWIQIGGHVLNAAQPLPDGSAAPVAGAWVQLETPGGEILHRVETGPLGRFTFERLVAGQYRVRTGAVGLGERDRLVTVPAESGDYDVRFP